MKVKTARLGLAISDQLRVKLYAALVVFYRNPLVDAVVTFGVLRFKHDRQEAGYVLRQLGVVARVGGGDEQRWGDDRLRSDLPDRLLE